MKRESSGRSSNFELYRIILMFGIAAHHYVISSGVMGQFDYSNVTCNMIFYSYSRCLVKLGTMDLRLLQGISW